MLRSSLVLELNTFAQESLDNNLSYGHAFGDYVSARRQGIGRELLQERLILAAASGLDYITATSFLGNPKISDYIERAGFKKLETERYSGSFKSAPVQDWILDLNEHSPKS